MLQQLWLWLWTVADYVYLRLLTAINPTIAPCLPSLVQDNRPVCAALYRLITAWHIFCRAKDCPDKQRRT